MNKTLWRRLPLLTAFLLAPALQGQQPSSTAPLFVANSAYLQGRTWADLKCTPGTALLPPLAPTLSQVAGGSLGARTYYVKVTYKNLGGETTASGQSALAISANYLLYVTSPVASGNATYYNVYASTVSGSETKQNTNPVLIGADWTEPVSGLISGAALPAANTTALYVDTAPGIAVVNGMRYPFPSVISTAVSPSITTYFFLSTSGALSTNNTGYLAGSIPLAKAVSNTTVVSSVDDDRSLLNGVYAPGGFTPGYQPTAGAGLTLNLAAGTAYCGNPPVPVFYAGGTLALTASQTNYVYLNPAATCVPAFNITGFAVGQIPLAKVVTGTSTITTVTDVRTWFIPSGCTMDSVGRLICTPLNAGKNIVMRGQLYSFKKANAVARNYITGTAWTIRASAADNSWRAIAWSPELGLFAAVAYTGTGDRVMTSPDGINWTIRTSAADNSWRAIAWSPELGLFAAVADSGTGNRVMTSPDGINWTIRTSAVDNTWRGIAWSPELGLFAAVADSGIGDRVMTWYCNRVF